MITTKSFTRECSQKLCLNEQQNPYHTTIVYCSVVTTWQYNKRDNYRYMNIVVLSMYANMSTYVTVRLNMFHMTSAIHTGFCATVATKQVSQFYIARVRTMKPDSQADKITAIPQKCRTGNTSHDLY